MENNNKFNWNNLNKEIPMVRKRPTSNSNPTIIENVIGLEYSGFMKFKTIDYSKEKAEQKKQIKPTDTGWDKINYKLLEAVITAKKQLIQ